MKIKKYNWKEKERTLLRFIKPGDIFFFENSPGEYYLGRIMAKSSLGHFAEIFANPVNNLDSIDIAAMQRVREPVILDSYSLFDRRAEGHWKIIASQEDYLTPVDEPVRFSYGAGPVRIKVDLLENEESITEEEAKSLPPYSPKGDFDVKEYLGIN